MADRRRLPACPDVYDHQTSDGFLWLLSQRGEIYRFDGIQFRLWPLPADGGSVGRIRNIVGDQTGGLWILGADGIAHVRHGAITSHVPLEGLMPDPANVSIDSDGSAWVVRGESGISEPLCHVTERTVKFLGKPDGVPIAPIDAILSDGMGGFWLGGHTALAHCHAGVSEMYPFERPQPDTGAPGILSLAPGPSGALWVGIFQMDPD